MYTLNPTSAGKSVAMFTVGTWIRVTGTQNCNASIFQRTQVKYSLDKAYLYVSNVKVRKSYIYNFLESKHLSSLD